MIEVKIGDCRELIKTLPDKSVDCIMTSPPYWGLRDYNTEPIIFDGLQDCEHDWTTYNRDNGGGHPSESAKIGATKKDIQRVYDYKADLCCKCGAWRGQLGLEPTPELFIKHLLNFFDDVKLKLKDEGNCFVNLGDTYATHTGKRSGQFGTDINAGNNSIFSKNRPKLSIPEKCLCMIPQRFAWSMVERSWILRNEIIWVKKNHMPESVTDRLTKAHEVIYHFVQQGKYYYNLDAIREPLSISSIERISQKRVFEQTVGLKQDTLRGIPENGNASRCNKMVQSLAKKYHESEFEEETNQKAFGTQREKHSDNQSRTTSCLHDGRNPLEVFHPLGKNPSDTWDIPTQPYPESHFAVFPLELVRRPILAGCPVGGTVLDPFAGSGTVGEFCRHNDRNAILFELNPEYEKLINDRAMIKIPELFSFASD